MHEIMSKVEFFMPTYRTDVHKSMTFMAVSQGKTGNGRDENGHPQLIN
jgi:hypothetical protein